MALSDISFNMVAILKQLSLDLSMLACSITKPPTTTAVAAGYSNDARHHR